RRGAEAGQMTSHGTVEAAGAALGVFRHGTRRRLAIATFAGTIGTGLNYAILPIYLVRAVGLSPTQVGLGMSVAGGIGLVAGFVLGHLADRLGPHWIVVA